MLPSGRQSTSPCEISQYIAETARPAACCGTAFYPTLGVLHKYPFILPHQQVDKGAIKFVLSGANIVGLSLTSPGFVGVSAAVDAIAAIMADGKQHALCVGVIKMSAEDIEKVNKGTGIENIHYLNDGLWLMKTYK
ncbi:Malignant T-cell-amplified sequence 1 [Lemmus lemmus]